MRHALADLLANDHPLFSYNIAELERAVGGDAIDTKLVADSIEQAHTVMRSLGLDPADSSAEEIYHALNSSVERQMAEQLLSDTRYTLIKVGGDVVSFNILDVVDNAHHELGFVNRRLDHAQRQLRLEILRRYAEHDRTHDELVHTLAEQASIKIEDDQYFTHIDQSLLTAGDSNKNGTRPSLLAIGDIFTDAFIKLDENYAVVEKDEDGKEWLKVPFGSKPPYERVDIIKSVGPSPNAAVSCARLGLDVSLMAWIGGDDVGREAMQHLNHEQVRTDSMVVEEDNATSYWYVLRHGSDRTMLVKSEEYQYVWRAPNTAPDWIYLAYIGKNSLTFHNELLEYLETNPEIKFVFQPATYHFEWGTEKLAGLYTRAYMTVMNREEAEQVTGVSHDDLHALANGLHELGPEIVAITDGSHGSYVSHNGRLQTIPNYPDPASPLDRTGAGDAFASTITAGLALGRTIEEAITWAPVNSASVVQKLGAQEGLLRMSELQQWLEKAPNDYVLKDVE